MKYRFVAVEGNIGAGKTSLANLLAQKNDAELIHEEFIENEFLPQFYKNPEEFAFPVEISFLMDRYRQLINLPTKNDEPNARFIADYFFDKSLVFATINLKPQYYNLFHDLYIVLATQLQQPDIIIYLHNLPQNLQQNIAKRGRSFETKIETAYLQKLEEGYRKYFEVADHFPILFINMKEKDFLAFDAHFSEINNLLQQDWPAGLHFLEL